MSDSFVRNWATAATAVVLVLLGILIGQRLGQVPAVGSDVERAPTTGISENTSARTATGEMAGTEGKTISKPVRFVIPDAFTSLPSEWRSLLTEDSFGGYAILFDPPRREIIIEQCRHPGYFNPNTGQPVPDGIEFCVNVLWGQLLSLDESSAQVMARDGNQLDLSLALTREGDQSHLGLSFPDHQMKLVPGSKNDLFQDMDTIPVMVEQKRRKFKFFEAEYQQRRQQQSEAADHGTEKG
jgi:hypothetical protein